MKTKSSETTNQNAKPIELIGTPSSGYVAFGKVFLLDNLNTKINKFIHNDKITSEIARTKNIFKDLIDEYSNISNSLSKNSNDISEIYESYAMVLEDETLELAITGLIKRGTSSQFAIKSVLDEQVEKLKSSDNQLLARRAYDFIELKNTLLQRLSDSVTSDIPKGSIVFGKHISTKDIYQFIKKGVVGFVSENGGLTSHTSIVARSFDVPYIFGVKNIINNCNVGNEAIIDASKGLVVINPKTELIKSYAIKINEFEAKKKSVLALKDIPTKTKDGKTIILKSNLDHQSELIESKFGGSDGIGLVRTENVVDDNFIFDENKQFEIYKQIVSSIYPKKATVRLFDYGADKPPKGFAINETNPALGQRGIRFLLANQGIMNTQLQAILRASSNKNIEILVPMVSKVDEMKEVKRQLEINKEILKESGYQFDENISLGAMIEVPSLIYKMDKLAEYVDFYSIGTNDLMQYFFAADRINENMNQYNDLDDSTFYTLIQSIIIKAKKQHKPISICGELAQSVENLNKLIGLGADSLSVTATNLLNIKNEIAQINSKQAKKDFVKYQKA